MHEVNERGNVIERSFRSTERYEFDFRICIPERGWKQYDTKEDAWYFGVWVHPHKREIITYAEGDITRVICLSEESFHAELKSMAEFYGPSPPAAVGIGKDGVITEFYDTRPA